MVCINVVVYGVKRRFDGVKSKIDIMYIWSKLLKFNIYFLRSSLIYCCICFPLYLTAFVESIKVQFLKLQAINLLIKDLRFWCKGVRFWCKDLRLNIENRIVDDREGEWALCLRCIEARALIQYYQFTISDGDKEHQVMFT